MSTDLAARQPGAEWDSELLQALYQLVFSTPDREVAGVLVGQPPAESEAGLPSIRAAIPTGQAFAVGQASLFDHQTWVQVHEAMGRYYRGLELVGWYVSRPGHGTELTEPDLLNHQRWFGRRDQVLLVVDSRSHRAAIYGWGPDGLLRLTEGPIARRFTRPPRAGFPVAATAFLATIGVVLGAMAFLVLLAVGS